MARTFFCFIVATICFITGATSAQDLIGQLTFPSDPAQWVNSPPLTKSALQGKAVFLWFYEENCPRCRGRWPEMMAVSKKFEDKPIVFIGVNSGNSRSSVEQYVREVKLNWPVIVDTNREFERAAGLDTPISLQNIFQARVLFANGSLQNGDWANLEGTAQLALNGASWKIDPSGIPEPLRPAWRSMEFGNYSAAATLVKKGLAASNPGLKQAAEQLNGFVQKEIQKDVTAATQAAAAGNKWEAFRTLERVSKQFSGFELPAEVAAQRKELAADDDVKNQLLAMKQLDSIKRSANISTPAAKKRVASQLDRFIKAFPNTSAAEEATELMKLVQ